MNRKALKSRAKEQLRGKWGYSALATIIMMAVISAGMAMPFLGRAIGAILTPILAYGITYYHLQISRGLNPEITDLFAGFNYFAVVLVAGLLMSIFTSLWTMLFVIPGIIAAIKYSFTYYIIIDNPGISALEAINISKQMTYGHKWDIFVLDLSFIGWLFLSSLTCGIGLFWLIPYMNVTYSNLYNNLKLGMQDQNIYG